MLEKVVFGYRITALIGEGGMGTVYVGVHPVIGKQVAVKFVHPWLIEGNPGYLDRFRREAQVLGSLAGHANIVQVDNFDSEHGRFLIMEYVGPENLRRAIHRQGRFPLDRTLAVAEQVARGLAHAHALGVAHRDIKPENVLMDTGGTAKVADFGIARVVGAKVISKLQSISMMGAPQPGDPPSVGQWPTGRTPPGMAKAAHHLPAPGTFLYMAPEQTQGEEGTAASDVYSWALVVYEMLTGRLPGRLPRMPGAVFGPAGRALDELLAQCWDDDPAARPASGSQLLEGLARVRAEAATGTALSPGGAPAALQTPQLADTAPALVVVTTPARRRTPPPPPEPLPPSLVLVPEGWFEMGSPPDDVDASDDEHPRHRVWLPAFRIATAPVTNREYYAFLRATAQRNPLFWDDPALTAPDQPVVGVSWQDASAYAAWLGLRLPTEAEWERAARGGLVGRRFPWGDEPAKGRACFGRSPEADAPEAARRYPPNRFGLHDMAGLVWEWVADFYDPAYYARSPERAPRGPQTGRRRVARGGAWDQGERFLRCAARIGLAPDTRDDDLGFRCAQDAGA